ncbi:MAG: DUF2325 domain-containing protein [Treponema sp.]|jgi:hypothetical protein|nr:DUF2325 domain-containing protein [Treponema sp.]
MSVVIIGGHDCMACRYKDICKEYGCTVKVYTQWRSNLARKIGQPDMMVLFTNPVSHKMTTIARQQAVRNNITLVQSHFGSGSTLRNILEAKIKGEAVNE